MTTPALVPHETVSLKNDPRFNEHWLQEQLIEKPSLLGLGDLEVRDSERRQPSGGRLDLLLEHVETRNRYEVEIQLGSLDESHIIRTIEYWDIERRRFPQYEHTAVIVAEDVTSRFLNVISLLNGTIPLIAIQLKGVEVNGAFTLIATRVVDRATLGTEEEDAGESVDRAFWERKASRDSLSIMDRLVNLVNQIRPGMSPNYNKHHVGLASGGMARNFVVFHPRKSYVLTNFKIPQDQEEELNARLVEEGLSLAGYDTRFGYYRVRISQNDIDSRENSITGLISKARDAYFG